MISEWRIFRSPGIKVETVMGGNSLEMGIGVRVEKPEGGVISLPLVMLSWGECLTAKSCITCDNTNGNTTLSEAQGVSLRITSDVRVEKYDGTRLGTIIGDRGGAPRFKGFVEDLTAKGVGLRVADSHTDPIRARRGGLRAGEEGRKAHLLGDKQIPSVEVFDEVTWKTFRGNTRDLGSILEETGQGYDYTPKEGLKNKSQMVETASGKLATPSGSASDRVGKFVTASELSRHKETLEDSTTRRCQALLRRRRDWAFGTVKKWNGRAFSCLFVLENGIGESILIPIPFSAFS
ncbi:hypothetical protein Tco_0703220 [Tanacetum coccineum]|uniref:Uncharacterized protein n=1 Tax=Tanacetum coccineum TaxID=301880 RepID=A0ABQ4XYC2_9ASTR